MAPSDQDWPVATEEPPTWDQLPGTHCIARWAIELREAINGEADASAWRLIGTGAAIESKDMDRCGATFQRVALEAGLRFISVSDDAAMDLRLDASCPFPAMAPVLIYLQPGDWMLKADEEKQGSELANAVRNFRRSLKSLMLGFNPAQPVIFATAAYDLDDIVPMLRAPGLFDRRFVVRPPSPTEIGLGFLNRLGMDICAESLIDSPHKVGMVVQDYPDKRTQGLHALHLQRKAAREQRKLTFIDLVEVGAQGSCESDPCPPDSDSRRKLAAVHEAGHAVVAMVDSAGRNTPEYLSIVAAPNYNGVSVDSVAYCYSVREQTTYASFRHQIRGYLAGRAAEEVVLGAGNVSGGCRTDLVHAHVLAYDGFALLGLAPNMDRAGTSASNLLVVVTGDDPSPAEEAHVHALTREFLADQYLEVVDLLVRHRSFLDDVTECLLQHQVMHHDILSGLWKTYRPFMEEGASAAVVCPAAQAGMPSSLQDSIDATA